MKSISSWKGPSALSPRVNPTVLTWKIEKVTRLAKPVALNDVSEASLLHLVQPERMLTILHPPATCEEELGERYL